MASIINIGLDVGNYDTKTQSTTTPSGFTACKKLPYGVKEYLYFNNMYYVPDNERFAYVRDKTVNDNCFILSLMGIGKEIIEIASSRKCIDGLQNEISKIAKINLGVGLPPTHCATLSDKLSNYYKEKFGEGVRFCFKNMEFSLTLGLCQVYPQDYAAVCTYMPKNEESILRKYKTYVAIDIGGHTLDIVFVEKGVPNLLKCDSRPLGILSMYELITREIEMEFGIRLTAESIHDVIKKEETILDDSVKNKILLLVEEWFEKIVNELRQFGIEFEVHPIVFIGGGALLFRPFINKCGMFKRYEFIPGANANAKGYCKLITAAAKRMR